MPSIKVKIGLLFLSPLVTLVCLENQLYLGIFGSYYKLHLSKNVFKSGLKRFVFSCLQYHMKMMRRVLGVIRRTKELHLRAQCL